MRGPELLISETTIGVCTWHLFCRFQKPQQRTLSSVVVVRSQHLGCDSETVYVAAWSVRGLHFLLAALRREKPVFSSN